MNYRKAALTMGRRAAEARMDDLCRITRQTGDRVLNEQTGQYETATITIYEDVCRVISPYRVPATPTGAGQTQNIENLRLDLPISRSLGIHSGDTVEIIHAETDPDMLGRIYTVSTAAQQSDATARRIPIQEVS